jgi:hypothetical protein
VRFLLARLWLRLDVSPLRAHLGKSRLHPTRSACASQPCRGAMLAASRASQGVAAPPVRLAANSEAKRCLKRSVSTTQCRAGSTSSTASTWAHS